MEIFTIGGFNEVGRNMTAVSTGEDVFIFDLGVFLPAIVQLQEQETGEQIYSEKKLRSIAAAKEDITVNLQGDGRTEYQSIVEVLDIVRRSGITNIGLATEVKIEKR